VLAFPSRRPPRRGAVAALLAFLLVFMLGVIAFAVDIGYIVLVHQEVQNAADSAALAGASKLADLEFKLFFATPGSATSIVQTATTNANAEAKSFAALNQGGSKFLTLSDADITVGYLGTPTGTSTIQAPNPPSVIPNTVQVIIRRDSSVTTGKLALFFAPVLGISSTDVQASAAATIQRGRITGFSVPNSSKRNLLLPIALDVNAWTALINNTTMPSGYTRQDSFTYATPTSAVAAPKNVTSGADGIPELQGIYPNSNAPGNFGLIDIGPDANDAPTFWDWITNGASADDMTYLAANHNGVAGSKDFQATPYYPATLKAGPGLKASDESYLQAIIGQSRIMPLFSGVQGNGQNATYTIIGFAPITLVDADLSGNNKHITVQPVPVVDPTAVNGSATGSTTQFIYRPLSLTR
jgi:Flp pilus assembly protein TadG